MCAQATPLCSLSGEIDDLAYISTKQNYSLIDGDQKSWCAPCLRWHRGIAWDLHEVSCLGEARMRPMDSAVTSVLQPLPFYSLNRHSQLVRCGSPIVQ